MNQQELKEEVIKAVNDDGAVTPAVEASESTPVVNSEVKKVEVQSVTPITVDPAKLQEQISNLNTALSQERNDKKQKIAELEQKVQESSGFMDRMKNVFVPEEPEEIIPMPVGISREEILQILDEREQEKQRTFEEQKRSDLIQSEIKDLEKIYNGEGGGLKYDDQEVLQWQKTNNKLYLTPKEAFSAWKQTEIIDYKVREALAGRKPVENVETSGGSPVQHEPAEALPKNDQQTRNAVLEAMENADREL